MYIGIPFISWIVCAMALDNLFSDDQPYSNLIPDMGTDSSSDSIFGINSDLSSVIDANGPSDESLDSEDDDNWKTLLAGGQTSPEFLADAPNDCSVEPEPASKIRKSRSTECKVKDPAVDIPPNFGDLGKDMQEQLYRGWVCPSPTPGESLLPVCSSRLTENTHFEDQISNPGVWTYTLMDSFICTSVHDRVWFENLINSEK